MRRKIIFSFVVSIALPMVSLADDALITLRDLEREMRANNLEILMARKKAEARRKRRPWLRPCPTPSIGFEVQNVGRLSNLTIGEEEMSMRGVVVTQEIPFPGKLSTMGKAAGKRAEQEQGK